MIWNWGLDTNHLHQENPEMQFQSCSPEGTGVWPGVFVTPSWAASRQHVHGNRDIRKKSSLLSFFCLWPRQTKDISATVQEQDGDCATAWLIWKMKFLAPTLTKIAVAFSHSQRGRASSEWPRGSFCCSLTLGCPFLHHGWHSKVLVGVN